MADGQDIALVTVRVVDGNGRTVPTASEEVVFTVSGSGRLLGVGNGNPASLEPDKASRRRVFNGRCLAIVQASGGKGTIAITARAAGLRPAVATLVAR